MDQLYAQALVIQQRKLDSAPLQFLFKFAKVFPEQMPPQMLVEFIDRVWLGSFENRSHARRLDHVHQHEVLMADEFQVTGEAFGQGGIVQSSKKHQQSPPAQAQTNK